MLKPRSIVLSLALIGCSVHAATLNEIAERALARSPDVQMKLHEFNASGSEQDAARGALRPRLDLEAYGGRERYDPAPGSSNYFNHPGASLQLRQLLFDGGVSRGEVTRLGYAKLGRYYDLLQSADDTAYESARAYLDVLRYRKLVDLARENWAVHKEIYEQIGERVQAGVGRRVDLEQAAGRLSLAQSNWLTDTSNLHDVSMRFERVVGEAPPVLAEAPTLTASLPQEKAIITDSLANNPSFLASVYNLRAARAATDVRRSSRAAPTVEFRASAGTERNRSGVDGNFQSASAQVVMSYNLYRGNADSARLRQASETYLAATEARNKSCRDVRQTAAISWNNVRRLQEQQRYLNQHLISTEKARDAYRQQFDIGQRTLLDLLDTENELFQARRSYINAEFDQRQAEYQVLAVSHRLLASLGLAPANAERPDADDGDPRDFEPTCATAVPVAEPLDLEAARALRPARPAPAPVPAPAAPAAPASLPEQCSFAANDWAAAWSAKDLEKYLGYYSTGFEPQTRADRADWHRFRAARLNKEWIKVELKEVQVKPLSKESCEVSFRQSYRSNDFKDDVAKRLVLRHEESGWKIQRELADTRSPTN